MTFGNSEIFALLLAVEIFAVAVAFFFVCRTLEPWVAAIRLWDLPGGRKDHGRPVLLSGGLAFFFALASAGIFSLVQAWSRESALLFAGALLAAGAGFLDDWKKSRGGGLGAREKLLAQVVASVLVLEAGIRLRLFGDETLNALATIVWFVAVQNAWNFLDNMDGLAAGIGLAAALCFAAIFASLEARDLALTAGALAGLCLGFLPRNFPVSRAFLGDAGTGCLGYAFAALSVAGSYVTPSGPGLVAVTVPLAVLAVPLFDMIQVVIVRMARGKPIYVGDQNHLSHRLARKLGNRRNAVLVLFGLGATLGILALFVPHVSLGWACGILAVQAALFLGVLFSTPR